MNHLEMGRVYHFNHKKQKNYFWSCLVNTLTAAPISELSKFDFEKKRNDELRGDVWMQLKRASQALICVKFNADYENTLCFYPNVRQHREK